MRRISLFIALGIVVFSFDAWAQFKRTSEPIRNAVADALGKGSLTSEGARPFHIRVAVSEPENPNSPYQGTIEEWWASPDQSRLQVNAKNGMRQTVVIANGNRTEKDEGDYFPLWLRRFVDAVNDPIPNAAAWTASGITIDQTTMPDGRRSDACARAQSKIGTGERATDAFSNVCFDGEGRLKFYGSPAYSMEFHDYRGFGKKQIARELVDSPEPGTNLVGKVEVLEELKHDQTDTLFEPLDAHDDRFRSAHANSEQMERMIAINPPIQWPTVRSGNTRGRLAIYISANIEGNVREAWPLNSDNAGLEDPAREQAMHWKITPAVDRDGKHLQVEGGVGFAFDTTIANPLPELSDSEIRALATQMVEPTWPSSGLTRGQIVKLQISVNEKGELTGIAMQGVPPAATGPLMIAIRKWQFRPLIRGGKPQYFHGNLEFTVK